MASSYTLEIPELSAFGTKVDDLPAALKTQIQAALSRASIRVQTTARAMAPVRTGRLRSSIMYKVNDDNTAVVYTPVDYADLVESGSGVYGPNREPITPTNGKVLATRTNPGWGERNKAGYYIIGRYQAGQQANPFFSRAATASFPLVREEFVALGQTIIDEMKDS
jgi:hypothetical protein